VRCEGVAPAIASSSCARDDAARRDGINSRSQNKKPSQVRRERQPAAGPL